MLSTNVSTAYPYKLSLIYKKTRLILGTRNINGINFLNYRQLNYYRV